MIRSSLALLVVLSVLSVLSSGCAGAPAEEGAGGAAGSGSLVPPPELTCGTLQEALDAPALTAALAAASPGSCVLLGSGTYQGSFVVPAGVALAGGAGQHPRLEGSSPDEPALRLVGGEGSAIVDLAVVSSPGIGVLVEGGPAQLRRLASRAAVETALVISCPAPGCGPEAEVAVIDCSLATSRFGLWARGAAVRVEGGSVSSNTTERLTGGYGIVASAGARLSVLRTEVTDNGETGVLVDGTGGTVAVLEDVRVDDNRGRGIWVQKVAATIEAPGVIVRGAETSISRNRIAGLGAVGSSGIIILDGLVADTIAVELPMGLGGHEAVGDGVGLFGGSGAVRVEGVTLTHNARAQLLIDEGEAGIIILDGIVEFAPEELGIVVQRTTGAAPEIPEDSRSTPGTELGVSAPELGLDP